MHKTVTDFEYVERCIASGKSYKVGTYIGYPIDAETAKKPQLGLSSGFVHLVDVDGHIIYGCGVTYFRNNCLRANLPEQVIIPKDRKSNLLKIGDVVAVAVKRPRDLMEGLRTGRVKEIEELYNTEGNKFIRVAVLTDKEKTNGQNCLVRRRPDNVIKF